MNVRLLPKRWLPWVGALLAAPLPAQAPTPPPTAPFIILKLDDLSSPSPAWKRTVEFLREKNVKSSIGIVCQSLEADRPAYFEWIKGIQETGLVEFWNHGWDHKQWKEGDKDVTEFKGAPYEHQKEHFSRSQRLAKEKLGITFRTFGAPFNAVDDVALKVMAEDPDVKVFLYGRPEQAAAVPNVLVLERTAMNIENPLFVPNSKRVLEDYRRLAGTRDCFVLQGHPNNWDDARFAEFQKLVACLAEQGVAFTTPYEYYQWRQASPKGLPPPPSPSVAAPAATISPASSPAAAPGAGRNFLVNGGFEDGTVGWDLFVSAEDRTVDCKLGVTSDKPHGGARAGQLTSDARARYALLQYVRGAAFAPGRRYRVSAWVRAGEDFEPQAGTPGFALRVSMFADKAASAQAQDALFYVGMDGRSVRGADASPLKNQEVPRSWTKLEGVFEVPPYTAKLNVCVFVWKGSGSFFVDDVALEDADDAAPPAR
jgi:peptidoglycan/xylan/chitin deacetylase (PgdA/CDA1 family)